METTEGITGVSGLNADGFLTDDSGWNEKVAEELARINEIWPLSDQHWKVINFVREYARKHGRGPSVNRIHKGTGLSSSRICELFPCGVVKGAYRIAGLPRPPGCA